MKVIEHYERANEPLISFEIIPPKRGGSIKTVFDALDKVMETVKPPFIDVTYHAPEVQVEEQPDGTLKKVVRRKRPGTIGLCAAILHRYGIDPVPHLLCGGFSKESAEDALIELNYLGIHNVLALRGDDHGSDAAYPLTGSANHYASDLVAQIHDMNQGIYLEKLVQAEPTDFCIGVAGYPEKHFESPNLKQDISFLKEKIDRGAEYIVTQMFYDNQKYFDFVKVCREEGINVPIIPGLKILKSEKQLTTLPKNFYIDFPEELVDEVRSNPEHAKEIGIKWAISQAKGLLDFGVPCLHFYIMNDTESVVQVMSNLKI